MGIGTGGTGARGIGARGIGKRLNLDFELRKFHLWVWLTQEPIRM